MAVTYYPQAAGAPYFCTCLVSDAKPASPPTGALLLEVDTAAAWTITQVHGTLDC